MGNQSAIDKKPEAPISKPPTSTLDKPPPAKTAEPVPSDGAKNASQSRVVQARMPVRIGPQAMHPVQDWLFKKGIIEHSAVAVVDDADNVEVSAGQTAPKIFGQTTIVDHAKRLEEERQNGTLRFDDPAKHDKFLKDKKPDPEKTKEVLRSSVASKEHTGNYGAPRTTPTGGVQPTICHSDSRNLVRRGLAEKDRAEVEASERARNEALARSMKRSVAIANDLDPDDV